MGWRNEQQQQRVWRPMGLLLFLSFLLLLFVSVQGFEGKPAGMENLLVFFSFVCFSLLTFVFISFSFLFLWVCFL
jgi:hypothetical protein